MKEEFKIIDQFDRSHPNDDYYFADEGADEEEIEAGEENADEEDEEETEEGVE